MIVILTFSSKMTFWKNNSNTLMNGNGIDSPKHTWGFVM